MADTAWSNNQNMKNIDPRKLAILLELVKETEGKPMDQLLPVLLTANKRLKDQNMTFTKEESEMLIELVSKNLSPKERMQLDMIRKMMPNKF